MIMGAHYDGKTIVPHTDLDLPADQPLEVEVHVLSPAESESVPELAPCEKPDITLLPFFGMWADREDVADAAAWVSQERAKWASRHSVTG